MAQPDVTVAGIREYLEALNFAWLEFSDEEIHDAAKEATEALDRLCTVLSD